MLSGEWIRDLGFYAIAAIVILAYGYVGQITFIGSLLFMSIYVVYFIIVIMVRILKIKRNSKVEKRKMMLFLKMKRIILNRKLNKCFMMNIWQI